MYHHWGMDYNARECKRSLHWIVMLYIDHDCACLVYGMNDLHVSLCNHLLLYIWISISEYSGVFDSGSGM